ncbi:MAG: diguanylate cyclase, partial [Lachnospiraceae bacterium]|nr:diguanylate cyclase [Lachnospiraceae bacterium]
DRIPAGDEYKEYALIRLDGENWESDDLANNKTIVDINDDFMGWDAWKEENKKGFDCTVSFQRDGNKIITTTENLGISLNVTTTIVEDIFDVYVSLTGDQCALTNIRIIND